MVGQRERWRRRAYFDHPSPLGASYDPPEANAAFADKHGFPFRLLSDVERAVGPAYGTARDPADPSAGYASRVTALITPDGTIAKHYVVSDVGAHPAEVLADLTGAVAR